MVNTKFEAYKIKRELKKSGIDYEFLRKEKNKFNELAGEEQSVGTLKGLYHEQNGYIQITTGETTQTRTKKTPMILCLCDDVNLLNLQVNDIVKINNKIYKLTGIVNIQEWNIISDISLEVVDDGVHA